MLKDRFGVTWVRGRDRVLDALTPVHWLAVAVATDTATSLILVVLE